MSSRRNNDGTWTHAFRQSFLNDLTMCPERARANYLAPDRDTHTDSTALGTAVHAGAEWALIEKRDEGTPSVDHIIEVALHELDLLEGWTKTKFPVETVYQLAERMARTWHREMLPNIEPLHVERTFNLPFHEDDQRTIHLTGTPDCVDNNHVTWDWKTASRAYEPWEKQRWAVQPTVYAWALWSQTLTDYPPMDRLVMPDQYFRYGILLHNGGHQYLDVVRSHGHVEWLRTQCVQVAEMIEANLPTWSLNDAGWHCHPTWCEKFVECKGATMPDDWTTTLKGTE